MSAGDLGGTEGGTGAGRSFSEEDRQAVLERTLERLLSWIGAIDSRIGFVFTIDVAMLGVLGALAPPSPNGWTRGELVTAALTALAMSASLAALVAAVMPRLDGPKRSLLFFGGIASYNFDRFRECMRELSFETYFADLAAQCHRNAEIAKKKYYWLKCAMVATCVAVVPWVVAIFLLYQPAKVQPSMAGGAATPAAASAITAVPEGT